MSLLMLLMLLFMTLFLFNIFNSFKKYIRSSLTIFSTNEIDSKSWNMVLITTWNPDHLMRVAFSSLLSRYWNVDCCDACSVHRMHLWSTSFFFVFFSDQPSSNVDPHITAVKTGMLLFQSRSSRWRRIII